MLGCAFFAAAMLTATPYAFDYAGRAADWVRSTGQVRSVVRDGSRVRTVREWTSPDGRLLVRSTETAYGGFPVLEYLPELVALGETEIVDGFRSLDFVRRTSAARLRLTRGSSCALTDFEAVPVALGGADGTNAFVQVSDFLGSSTQWTPWFGVDFAEGDRAWFALGWSGTWRAEHAFADGAYRLRVGMTDSHFRLHAGETLRLPSVLVLENADLTTVHRFMREEKSPRNAKGELIAPVMPIQGGGGNKSAAFMKKVVAWSKAQDLPFDCLWIDAGWNGSAHETDRIRDCGSQWMNYIGDWRFNPKVHPDGNLRGVADAVHAAGMKMLLWFSPEHATARGDCAWMPVGDDRKGDWTPPPVYLEHPDWFLPLVGGDYGETLATLDMGNPEARAWILEESSRIIRENALDVFRVDVNGDHVPRWRAADAPDRKGVTEAKFVAGVYAYWDELRRRFPDLLLDNCASGCRRLDFEAVSRAHCYCRTDYAVSHHGPRQLVAQQNGLLNTLAFMPFQGISSAPAVFFDDYSFYSTLGPCTLFGPSGWYWDHGLTERDFTAEEIAWFKKVFGVAARTRPYFLGDFHPLVDLFEPAPYNNPRHKNNYDQDPEERRFFAYQMHRADLDAGFVAVFRRVNVHANAFAAELGGIDPSATYEVEVVDGETRRMPGADLRDFRLPMPRLRDVRLVFYRKVSGADAVGRFDAAMSGRTADKADDGIRWIDGKDLPLEGGAVGKTGTPYQRLPDDLSTNVNAGVRSMRWHTSGMQFRFRTDSDFLVIRFTNNSRGFYHMPELGVSGTDVYRYDEAAKRWRFVRSSHLAKAEGRTRTYRLPWKPGEACIVNLPLYAGISDFTLGVSPTAKVERVPHAGGIEKPVVFYGTSITQGASASRPGLGFVNIVGRRLDVPVVGLGFSGSGRMELEMSEQLARIDASCYVLDCLWNMDGVRPALGAGGAFHDMRDPKYPQCVPHERFEPFVRNLRRLRPATPIVIAEQSDVFAGADTNRFAAKNAFVRSVYEKLVAEGMTGLHYLPADRLYADDSEGTTDGIHPNDYGMMSMAEAFSSVVGRALGLFEERKR